MESSQFYTVKPIKNATPFKSKSVLCKKCRLHHFCVDGNYPLLHYVFRKWAESNFDHDYTSYCSTTQCYNSYIHFAFFFKGSTEVYSFNEFVSQLIDDFGLGFAPQDLAKNPTLLSGCSLNHDPICSHRLCKKQRGVCDFVDMPSD